MFCIIGYESEGDTLNSYKKKPEILAEEISRLPYGAGIIDVSPQEYASVNDGDTVTVSSYSTSEYKQLVLTPKTACFYVDAVKSGKDYYALFMKDGELISVKTRHDIGGYGNPLGERHNTYYDGKRRI